MNIVFVNRFFYPDHSATSQLLSDLAFDLARQGHHVRVVTSRLHYDDPNARLAPDEGIDGVAVHRLWTSRFGRGSLLGRAMDYLTFYSSAMWHLMWSLRRGDVVVAKTDPPLISVVVALCARLRGATLVNWLQDVFPEVASALNLKLTQGRMGRVLTAARNWSLKSAHCNVVLGQRMAELLCAQGLPTRQVRVIPNWSDGQAIRPLAPSANALRQAWGMAGRFVAAYSGNMGRAHELDTIVQAARLLQGHPHIVFLFIGDGHGRQALAQATAGMAHVVLQPYQPRDMLGQSLTLPDVHFISLRPEMEGLIVPSKFYGVMAAGRPAVFIGAPDGEVARQLQTHACGHTIGPDDAQGLASLLLAMSRDQALTALMGQRARALFDREFDQAVALQAWRSVLSDAASARTA
jgi:colanic acid biosynthesis glycosyl transferase WcaI